MESGLRLKVILEKETRRLAIAAPVTFEKLKEVVQGFQVNGDSTIRYEDDEGELVTLASDSDLAEAVFVMQESNQKVLKVYIGSSAPAARALESSFSSGKSEATLQEPLLQKSGSPRLPQAEATPAENWYPSLNGFSFFSAPVAGPAPSPQRQQPQEEKQAQTAASTSEAEEKTDQAKETFTFDQALQYLVDLADSIKDKDRVKMELVLIVSRLATYDGSATWDEFISSLVALAPFTASLPCFSEPEVFVFLQCCEVVAKFIDEEVESAMLYPLPEHVGILIAMLSDAFFGNLLRMSGMPEQVQRILRHISACVKKLEAFGPRGISSDSVVHANVECDGCKVNPIVGNRYKCQFCADYDLCENCENAGMHPAEHEMIKFKRPVQNYAPQLHFAAPFGHGPHPFAFGGPFNHHRDHHQHHHDHHMRRKWKNSKCPWNGSK